MASARLLNFWRPKRGATPLCGVVARATVRGESMGAILELGARSLLEASAADRAAVWLQSAHHPEIYQGAIVEAGSGIVPEEWKQLDVSPLFFGKLLDRDRKSTRLNSSHGYISYAVFCLKKKKHQMTNITKIGTHTSL